MILGPLPFVKIISSIRVFIVIIFALLQYLESSLQVPVRFQTFVNLSQDEFLYTLFNQLLSTVLDLGGVVTTACVNSMPGLVHESHVLSEELDFVLRVVEECSKTVLAHALDKVCNEAFNLGTTDCIYSEIMHKFVNEAN